MIVITPAAAEQIRRATTADMQGLMLRIAAKRDADGHVEYMMGFDERGEEDAEYTSEGVQILISEFSKDLLKGIVLDFVELQPGEFQFIFAPAEKDPARPRADRH